MLTIIPYCFTKQSIINEFINTQQYDNWIKTQCKNHRIKKVRNGLYVTLDSIGQIHATKFEIASKISNTSFVAYHSALDYYGITNQVFNNMIVGSKTRFNSFEFEGIDYNFKLVENYEQVVFIKEGNLRVTTLERTIIDCIDNIDLAGGIEELLNALNQVRILNEDKLLSALKSYNQVFLYQKTGFILEQFKEELKLSDNFFNILRSYLTNQVKYFLQNEYNNIEYNSKWKLMAPKDLKSRIYH